MAKVNRKLATILATDCVDFSKHMESQEELTLSNLTSCRAIIDPVIEEHGGRIFHTAGDSVIAEFGSPVECVNAAMEFQELLAARNEEAQGKNDRPAGGDKTCVPLHRGIRAQPLALRWGIVP